MRRDVYTRPAGKPLRVPVITPERPAAPAAVPDIPAAPVMVDKFTECHVTPPNVAARMVAAFGRCGDWLTLEPSAGTGSLLRALLDAGQSQFEITAIERHIGLANALRGEFPVPVINECFLEYADRVRGGVEFPRVIMNPPFSQVRKHIAAALSLMGRGGHPEPARLVALVPVTFEHPDAVTLERLPADTFATARVFTKIIQIDKP